MERRLRLTVPNAVRGVDPITGPLIGSEEGDATPKEDLGLSGVVPDVIIDDVVPIIVTVETDTPVVEIGHQGEIDGNLCEVGGRASVLQSVTEQFQVTVAGLDTGILIPGAPLLMGVAEALQMTTPRSPTTCILAPGTSMLVCVAQQFQVTVMRSMVTCILVPRTTMLVGVTETLEVTVL